MTGNSDTHEYPVSQKSVILFALLFLLHKASYSLSLVLISIAFFLFLAEDPGEVLLVFFGRRDCIYKTLRKTNYRSVQQGSATPGTRATCGTREDIPWHAK